jgi:flagellin-like hook-associated protein FlgL
MLNMQSRYNDLMEKISTQKKVNRASDDPIAAAKIVDIRQGIAANGQYQKNIADGDAWISVSESTLSQAYELLTMARGIALGEAGGTADAASRRIAAQNIQSYIDEMVTLANEKIGERYLFSGSRNGVAPFSTTAMKADIAAVETAGNNVFNGAVAASAAYAGTEDKTYKVRITSGGSLDAATAQISVDGGTTWRNTTEDGIDLSVAGAMAGGTIQFGDGVFLTLDDGGGAANFAEDDVFVVNAFANGGVAVEPPSPDAPYASTGTVAASVTYSGTANKTYVVKITGNPNAPGVAAAQISTDGGRTWEATALDANGDIRLGGNNVKLTIGDAANETFGENDIFIVHATAGGYYQGNGDPLSMTINRGITIAYNITGAEAFTAGSDGIGVDVFRTLNDLKTALANNDAQGISGQLENLKNAQQQILLNQSLCGTKANHLEMAKKSLVNLGERLTLLLSNAQDADLAEFAMRLSLQELALQASYAMSAKIGATTILNFLK